MACALEPNIEYMAPTLGNTTAESEQGCCSACNNNYYCKAWTYRTKSKICELKESKGNRKLVSALEKVWSGEEVTVESYHDRPFFRRTNSGGMEIHNCVLGFWLEWSGCSRKCDGGVRSRTRKIIHHPTPGGQKCGATVERVKCNQHKCSVYHWSYSAWGPCKIDESHGSCIQSRNVYCSGSDGSEIYGRQSTQFCRGLAPNPRMFCSGCNTALAQAVPAKPVVQVYKPAGKPMQSQSSSSK